MADWSIKVTIKKQEWLNDPPARWNHGLSMAGKEWKRQNQNNPGSRSGALARASTYKITQRGKTIQFFSTFYWIFLMKGTGIYGPKGTPIYPVHGPFLVFQVQGAGMLAHSSGVKATRRSVTPEPSQNTGTVFARSVRGTIWPGRLAEIQQAVKAAFVTGIANNASDQ